MGVALNQAKKLEVAELSIQNSATRSNKRLKPDGRGVNRIAEGHTSRLARL